MPLSDDTGFVKYVSSGNRTRPQHNGNEPAGWGWYRSRLFTGDDSSAATKRGLRGLSFSSFPLNAHFTLKNLAVIPLRDRFWPVLSAKLIRTWQTFSMGLLRARTATKKKKRVSNILWHQHAVAMDYGGNISSTISLSTIYMKIAQRMYWTWETFRNKVLIVLRGLNLCLESETKIIIL